MNDAPEYSTAEHCWCCGSTRQPIYLDDTNGKMICSRCDKALEHEVEDFWNGDDD